MTADLHGIPNLFAAERDVFRGGQPSPEGWRWLCGEGIHTVVKLNTEAEGSDDYAESLCMDVHRFPISWLRQTIWRPRQSDLVAAVTVIMRRTGPVFVHCQHGQDRTGLVIGCLRLAQGWFKDEADKEMEEHGFHEVALQGLEGRWGTQVAEEWAEAFKK